MRSMVKESDADSCRAHKRYESVYGEKICRRASINFFTSCDVGTRMAGARRSQSATVQGACGIIHPATHLRSVTPRKAAARWDRRSTCPPWGRGPGCRALLGGAAAGIRARMRAPQERRRRRRGRPRPRRCALQRRAARLPPFGARCREGPPGFHTLTVQGDLAVPPKSMLS
jgi:hypothetical protein